MVWEYSISYTTTLMVAWLSAYLVMLCEKPTLFYLTTVICWVITHPASVRHLLCFSPVFPFFLYFHLGGLRDRQCEHRVSGGPGVLRQPVCGERRMLDTGGLEDYKRACDFYLAKRHASLQAQWNRSPSLGSPYGKELRVASSQQPARNWAPQSNSPKGIESCHLPHR